MTQPVYLKQPKTKLVAYLLWFFLGTWGAHRFYLKQYKTAVAYVIVTGIIFISNIGMMMSVLSDARSANYYDTSYSPYGAATGFISLLSWVVWVAWIVDAFLIPKMIRERNSSIYGAYQNQGYGMPQYTNQQPTYLPPTQQFYAPQEPPAAPQAYTPPASYVAPATYEAPPTYSPPVQQHPTVNLHKDPETPDKPSGLPPIA